ncbi:MAG: MBL fold metallo-hydrolase [Clostridia bacterium]|nr:MBL fold metallo-hydrolase [Clostridia bacterium]
MLKIDVLASGSKGNSILVSSGEKRLLIDCGITIRALTKALKERSLALPDVKAVLVTHEHGDHVSSCAQLTDAYGIPVFANAVTMSALKRKTGLRGGYYYEETSPFTLCGMEIRPFRTSHDAVYPVGYSISDADSKFTYATDLGYFSSSVKEAALGSNLILIESNHDVEMLLNGPYPRYLKERILSSRGHLSNEHCAAAVRELLESGTKRFILGHLSEQNNTYDLALSTTQNLLMRSGAKQGEDYELHVATQQGLPLTLEVK